MQTQIDIDSKITEAEACRSMQLFNDSLQMCRPRKQLCTQKLKTASGC